MDMIAETRSSDTHVVGPSPDGDEPDGNHGALVRRWFGVGSAASVPAREAGARATRDALRGRDPALLVVFCSGLLDPAGVLAGVHEVAGDDVPLIGCGGEAIITPGGQQRSGVAVVALGGPGFTVRTAFAQPARDRQRAAGARIATCALDLMAAVGAADTAAAGGVDPDTASGQPHQVLLMFTDGMANEHEEVLAGAYGVVGASVPLIGGSASPDENRRRRTFHLYGHDVLEDAVVGAAIASEAPFGVGLRHGWHRVGEPMSVTHSAGGHVFTLDDRPALATYLERLSAPPEAYTNREVFTRFADTRPLGVDRRGGADVRNVSSTELHREGWLRSSGEIPEGGLVWLMEGDEASVLAAAGDAFTDAVDDLGGAPPLGFLAFDCASRRRLLGEAGVKEEIGLMQARAGGAPLAGFYTWGEIARTRGIHGYHNQTLVVLAVG
jgi:hypothetical protein